MKNFILNRNNFKKTDKQPDYKLSVNIGTNEKPNYVQGGAGWIRKNSKGETFLSVTLSDLYVDHTKGVARAGFDLVQEGIDRVKEMPEMVETDNVDPDSIPF